MVEQKDNYPLGQVADIIINLLNEIKPSQCFEFTNILLAKMQTSSIEMFKYLSIAIRGKDFDSDLKSDPQGSRPTNPPQPVHKTQGHSISNNHRKPLVIPAGLKNYRNTGFLNSILQCFAHFDAFETMIGSITGSLFLTASFKCLIQKLRTGDGVSDILKQFVRYSALEGGYGDGNLEDAKGFYAFMIEKLAEDIPKDILESTCLVKQTDIFKFERCGHENPIHRVSPFISLQGDKRNWQVSLREYLLDTTYEGDYYCEKCGSREHGTKSTETQYPEVLVVYFHQEIELLLESIFEVKKPVSYGWPVTIQQYRAEVIVSRSGTGRDIGHYWATTLKGSDAVLYSDMEVNKTNKSCMAYMVFFKKLS